MPTWKKVVVSGSAISQLANDANYLAAGGTFSSSVDSRLDAVEAGGGTAALSQSAHTQRVALNTAQTTANSTLSSSIATALRAERVAGDNTLSSSAATALRSEYVAGDSALSASAHTQREAVKGLATTANNTLSSSIATALRSEYVAGDSALSASAHTQREAIKGLATTANNSLSSSKAAALRTEYVAGDTALSGALNTRLEELEAGGGTAALSASAHTQREAIKGLATTANNSLSSSTATALRAEYVAADTALSGAQKTYVDAKVAGIVNSAPATLDTLDELAAALNDDPNFSASIATSIGNRLLTSTHNTYSGSSAAALRTEYKAGDTALSSSAATALRAERVAGDSALSASAHTQREAIKGLATTANNTLSSSIATALRAEYVAADSALSASAATANNSSAITVRNLNNQTVDFGTGEVTASRFKGDGSGITNITVDQNATVAATFTNQTSVSTDHNFDTKNVLVQVYNSSDQQIIPATVTSTNVNRTTVTFDSSTSGTIVIARGGHIVSGSVNSFGGQAPEYYAASGSTHTQRLAVVATLSASAHAARAGGATSASAHTQRIAVVNVHSSSAATALRAEYVAGDAALSASAHTQREAIKGLATTANNSLSSSKSTALRAEYVAADTALSSSQKTYIDAKVAGIVNSAPATLDTLDELAAALNDDPNFSASIATSIGNRLLTATHTAFSSSNAAALRTEYKAGDTALSGAAHTQREAIKGLATSANNSLSSSAAGALRTEYKAGDTALSSSLNTRIVALEGAGTTSALSASAHTQREAIKGLATSANNTLSSSKATALRAEYVAGDSALSASAHTQREAIKGLATTANNSLSSSTATALRAEIVAGDNALSGAAHTQREAIKGLATTANNSLSSSISTALRAEWLAQDTALSASQNTYINAKVAGIVNSAPATLDTLDELAAALNDDPNFSASIATSIGNKLATATHTAFSSSNASALRTEYKAGDTALSSSLNTRIVALEGAGTTAALSASAHTQREAIKGLATTANNTLSSSKATALRAEYVAGDSALSASAHTQREAIKGLATTANNTLSSSKATALRAEYVAGDSALSASAHTQREAIKGLATTANNSLSSSKSTALRAEIVAGDAALSASAHSDRVAKVAALSASAHTARGTIESSFTIAAGIGSNDTFNTGETLTFAGTANEIETTVSNNQIQVGIVTNPTLTGDVTVTGDLIVTGDTIENQVTNLNIEDKFILLNSGSSTATDETGIIFGGTNGAAGAGAALVWNGDYNSNDGRLGVANAVAWDASTATVNYHLAGVFAGNSSDAATAQADHVGNIRVDGDDIYIYSGS